MGSMKPESTGRSFENKEQPLLPYVVQDALSSSDTREPMKTRVALLALTFTVLSPAAENSPFYPPIRNDDLTTLGQLIRDSGPKARDARATRRSCTLRRSAAWKACASFSMPAPTPT
jgi:hypothetical protein